MKIVMINDVGVPPYRYGGIELYTRRLADLLHLGSHQVQLVVPLNTKVPDDPSIVAVAPAGNLWGSWKDIALSYTILSPRLYVAANMACHDADVIHSHNPFAAGLAGGLLSRKYRKRSVLTYHYWGIYERFLAGKRVSARERIAHFATRMYDQIVVNTKSMKDAIVNRANVPESKITIIPPFVDHTTFRPHLSGQVIRSRHSLPGDSIVALYVGRLTAGKGISDLITAMTHLALPQLYLLIVGDGDACNDLQAHVNIQQLAHRVIFVGKVSDDILPLYYAACDFFVLPTYGESFGMVLLEAWASGKPVITSDFPILKNDVVEDGHNGLTFRMGCPISLAAVIRRIAYDDSLRRSLGSNGRATVERHYSRKLFIERYEGVYRRARQLSG